MGTLRVGRLRVGTLRAVRSGANMLGRLGRLMAAPQTTKHWQIMKDLYGVVHCLGTASHVPKIMKHSQIMKDLSGDLLFWDSTTGTPNNETATNNDVRLNRGNNDITVVVL